MMGTVGPGEQRTIFVGEARASSEDHEGAPTLNEALESAAGQAIEAGIIGPGRTAMFDVLFIEVELGNQHPRTYRIGVAEKGDGEI